MNILISRIGMRGDTFFAMPAVLNIRAAYPHATITAICSPLGKDVISFYRPCVDHIFVLEPYRFDKSVTAIRKQLKQSFDLIINFDTHPDYHQFIQTQYPCKQYYRMVAADQPSTDRTLTQNTSGEIVHIVKRYNQLVAKAGIPITVHQYTIPNIPKSVQTYAIQYQKKYKANHETQLIGLHPGNHGLNTNTMFQKSHSITVRGQSIILTNLRYTVSNKTRT